MGQEVRGLPQLFKAHDYCSYRQGRVENVNYNFKGLKVSCNLGQCSGCEYRLKAMKRVRRNRENEKN